MTSEIYYLGGPTNSYNGVLGFSALKENINFRGKGKYSFTYIDGTTTKISSRIAKNINETLVIGRGGLFREDGTCSLDLDLVGAPNIIVFGADEYLHHMEADRVLDVYGALVRDHRTYIVSVGSLGMTEKMVKHGIDISDVYVVPCASMFGDVSLPDHPVFDTKVKKVGINISTYTKHLRKDIVSYVDKITSFVQYINDNFDVEIFFIDDACESHTPMEDRLLLSLPQYHRVRDIFAGDIYPPSDVGSRLYNGIYMEMDIILGTGVQSAITSVGQGTPFMRLGDDPLLKSFAQDAEITHGGYLNGGTITEDFKDLYDNLSYYEDKINARREQYRHSYNWFIDEIIESIQ